MTLFGHKKKKKKRAPHGGALSKNKTNIKRATRGIGEQTIYTFSREKLSVLTERRKPHLLSDTRQGDVLSEEKTRKARERYIPRKDRGPWGGDVKRKLLMVLKNGK